MAGVQRWALVACGVAWLSGIALAALLPIASLGAPLLLAGVLCLGVTIALAVMMARGASGRAWLSALVGCGLLAVALLGMARFVFAAPGNDPHSITRLGYGQKVDVRGTVVGDPDVRAKGAFLAVAVQSVSPTQQNAWQLVDGTVQVYALGLPGAFAPEYGDAVLFTGVLAAPIHAPPGIDADLGAAQVDVVTHGNGNPLLGAIYQMRTALAVALERALPAPEAALIIGILLGLKTPVLRARLPLFVRTGTIHLVVTSGLKVTLVGDIAARLARPLGRWVSLIGSLTVVSGYVVLSGAGPAAIRAGIMGVILILARFLGRDYDVLNALAVACILMTAITPSVLWDAGFQLSAAGTLGIALLVPRLRAPLLAWLGRWRVGRVTADVLASTLAAQLATLPIVAITFGIISFVALLTNLLLVPFLPLFLILGALVGVGGLIAPGIGSVLGTLSFPILRLADIIIEGTAALPGAAATVGTIPGWIIPAWIIALGCVPLWWRAPGKAAHAPTPNRLPRPLRLAIGLAVALALFAGSVGVSAATLPPARFSITFLDVPGGPAAVARLANGRVILIDGGADGTALLNALAGVLPFWQRTIDLVVVTEARPGHFVGLVSLLSAYHIGEVIDPGALHPTTPYAVWYTDLQQARIPLVRVSRGTVITLDTGTTLDVLNPPQPLVITKSHQEDTNALIFRLATPGLAILFAGDASDEALAASVGEDLRSDVVQLCRMPSEGILAGTATEDFLRLAEPRLVIVAPSARPAPKAGSLAAAPAPDDPAALPDMLAIHQAQAGAVTLNSNGATWGMTL